MIPANRRRQAILEGMSGSAFDRFVAAHPEYASTRVLDERRVSDYRRLDEQRHVYLDYTGSSLYAASQVREHATFLSAHVFGNPHSASLSSSAATTYLERARHQVLEWFNAVGEYTVVFTLNASGALKHVAESYPF